MSTTPETMNAAVIGLGGMGRRHLQSIAQAGMQTIAVCDANSEALTAAAVQCESRPQVFSDWRELLAALGPEIDLLTIATNGPSHREIAVAAASAGVGRIMCEKPMATSGHAAREIAEACEAAGTRLAINLSRRFAERFIRLKALLRGGAIGEVKHMNISVGAGGLGCIGTHYFDCVAWLVDTAPAWVSGEIDVNPAPNVRGAQFFDPGGRGLVGYENGMSACFQLLGDVAITPLMQIIGTDGYVDFDGWSPPANGKATVFARPADQRLNPKTRFIQPERIAFDLGPALDVVSATRACIEDLVGAHREQTVTAGISAVDTVIAFHLSSTRGGEKIGLPLTGKDLEYDVPVT